MGSEFLEHLYRLLGGCLMPVDGQRAVYYLLHVLAQMFNVLQCDGASYLQVAVVSVAHGNVYHHAAVGENVVHRLAKHEEECACVGSRTRRRVEVEKLYVLVVIYAVVHAFHLVVHFCAHRAVGHVHFILIKNVRKCTSYFCR